MAKAAAEVDNWCWRLPLRDFPPAIGHADWYFDHLAHPDDGPYGWDRNTRRAPAESAPPTLHVTGWLDVFLDGVIQQFQHMRAQSPQPQQLIIGPWIHGPNEIGVSRVGEMDFGCEAQVDFNELRCAWFDRWLKPTANGPSNTVPIRAFLMGANRWIDLADWPPPGARARLLYLREGTGQDASSLNNGGLTFDAPTGAERPDSFVYDPQTPIQSLLTYPALGPRDHRQVEGGMLTYTTDPLEQHLTVLGPVQASLYALSSAPDTDWVVRLCDVWPDGRSMSVCDGILRARYRDSLEKPRLIGAEQLVCFDIDMVATGQLFRAGHRVRVEVTSSDFPRYDRNLNTGGPLVEDIRCERAVNTVFHDVLRRSYIALSTVHDRGD